MLKLNNQQLKRQSRTKNSVSHDPKVVLYFPSSQKHLTLHMLMPSAYCSINNKRMGVVTQQPTKHETPSSNTC